MAGEEGLPLVGNAIGQGHRDQRIMMSITAALQIVTTIACVPSLVSLWHPTYFPYTGIEQTGWSWLGVNSFFFAWPLIWAVAHPGNGPAAAAGCMLCAFYWGYVDLAMLSEWLRGLLSITAAVDFTIHLVLCAFCAHAAWGGVASPTTTSRTDGGSTQKRSFRKAALILASVQTFLAFLSCWSFSLIISVPSFDREAAPWEWNSAVLLTLTLAMLWAAFLTRGGYVDETKQAMCAFCAIMFTVQFVLTTFSWSYLHFVGHSIITSFVLAADAILLTLAALK